MIGSITYTYDVVVWKEAQEDVMCLCMGFNCQSERERERERERDWLSALWMHSTNQNERERTPLCFAN